MNNGLIIIVSGPSGVGKKTIIDKFINDPKLNLCYSISMTTRKPRINEINGVDYFFVTDEEFNKAIKQDQLLEWAEFANNKYGTPINKIFEKIQEGKNIILEIEVQGATTVKRLLPRDSFISVFIVPPSIDELEKRLRTRNTENEEKIKVRIERAKKEINLVDEYDYTVLNDDADVAAEKMKKIIENATSKKNN